MVIVEVGTVGIAGARARFEGQGYGTEGDVHRGVCRVEGGRALKGI